MTDSLTEEPPPGSFVADCDGDRWVRYLDDWYCLSDPDIVGGLATWEQVNEYAPIVFADPATPPEGTDPA